MDGHAHLALPLQIPDQFLLQLHVHGDLLPLVLQLSDATSQRVSTLTPGRGGKGWTQIVRWLSG